MCIFNAEHKVLIPQPIIESHTLLKVVVLTAEEGIDLTLQRTFCLTACLLVRQLGDFNLPFVDFELSQVAISQQFIQSFAELREN